MKYLKWKNKAFFHACKFVGREEIYLLDSNINISASDLVADPYVRGYYSLVLIQFRDEGGYDRALFCPLPIVMDSKKKGAKRIREFLHEVPVLDIEKYHSISRWVIDDTLETMSLCIGRLIEVYTEILHSPYEIQKKVNETLASLPSWNKRKIIRELGPHSVLISEEDGKEDRIEIEDAIRIKNKYPEIEYEMNDMIKEKIDQRFEGDVEKYLREGYGGVFLKHYEPIQELSFRSRRDMYIKGEECKLCVYKRAGEEWARIFVIIGD